MDINKLTTQLNGTQATRENTKNAGVSSTGDAKPNVSDKVTLEGYQFKKNEVLFAKSEFDKQSQAAFDKVKALKVQLNEFNQASAESAEKAAATKLGQTINSPDVWESIARKMLDG